MGNWILVRLCMACAVILVSAPLIDLYKIADCTIGKCTVRIKAKECEQ